MDLHTDPLKVNNGSLTTNPLKTDGRPRRPLGVTILAVFAIIAAVLCMLSLFSFLTYLSFSSVIGPSLPTFSIVFFTLIIILLVIFILIAYGFWKGFRWSWFLAVIFSLVMIGLQVGMMIFLISSGLFTTPLIPSEMFQVLQIFATISIVTAIVIYAIVVFYLTRPWVKSYFQVGQPGQILQTLHRSKKPIVIGVVLLFVLAFILIWGFTPTGEITVLRITQSPENPQPGDRIVVTAEITGGSPFGGAGLQVSYNSVSKAGGGTGSMPMIPLGNGKYSWNTYGGNRTVLWYQIFSGSTLLADSVIKIGLNEDNITEPIIANITQVPEHPTTSTDVIEIHVDIRSTFNITKTEVPYEWISGSAGGGSSTGLTHIGGTTYKIMFGSGFGSIGHQTHQFQGGTTIYYRIIVFDENKNAAVSPTQIVSIL